MTTASLPKISIGGTPVQILLVEDSPSDVKMTVHALRAGRISNELHVVGNGDDAIAFLSREGRFSDAPRPDLILLDLNLPGKDGREVLEEIKTDEDLRRIPVVILTTSAAEADVLRSYQLHANCYITKPVGLDAFLETVRSIEGFWLTVVHLPDRG